MNYIAFNKQIEFHTSQHRFRGLFAGKRGGKTEAGAVEAIIHAEKQFNKVHSDIDLYAGAIIAPTNDMLRRLSLRKFFAYAKPFKYDYHQTHNEIRWHNGSIIYGISAEHPQRIEGLKLSWAWVDEGLQCSEQLFLELVARLADTQGRLWLTSSLGVQYLNPKNHWAYKYFKAQPNEDTRAFEWSTKDNPYFPAQEIDRLRNTLDPKTFRQMFEIDWNAPVTSMVYDDFDEQNVIRGYVYDPNLEVSCVVDWGWNHPMACGFFQFDHRKNRVVLFDEIVGSKITLDVLWERIKAKNYRITNYFCDIAGNQEREQLGKSNVQWFKDKANIHFRSRSTLINYGIPIVRTWIKSGLGQRRFLIDEIRCPKSLDGIKNYRYPEKDGIITDEAPLKKDDDCSDMIRYYFVNRHDPEYLKPTFNEFDRWGQWQK